MSSGCRKFRASSPSTSRASQPVSGFQAAFPYYWNIAPNRDATFTFIESTKRGPAVDGEFRYLQPSYSGEAELRLLPNDRQYGNHSRHAFRFLHPRPLVRGWSWVRRFKRHFLA